jgi:anti-sigma factor RsiW
MMMSQRRGVLLQHPWFQALEPAQVPVAIDECLTFAVHDLAALAEGNLSQDGRRRLAAHLSRCHTCMATLHAIVEDTQPGRGSGDHSLAAWLATVVATAGESLRDGADSDKSNNT